MCVCVRETIFDARCVAVILFKVSANRRGDVIPPREKTSERYETNCILLICFASSAKIAATIYRDFNLHSSVLCTS